MASTTAPDVVTEPSRPPAVILIVTSNDRERAAVLGHLRRRYRDDYDIHTDGSTALALQRLKSLRDDCHDLAIMLVGWELSDGKGIDLLSQAQTFHPHAMRALLVSRTGAPGADPALAAEYARAATLGDVHRIVPGPAAVTDEQFNFAVQELLHEWARQNRPQFEVIRIVGHRWSEACHRFRDHLERGGVPYGFYEPDSPEGRTLLEHAGTTGPLPIAVLHDGQVFVQPTALEIVEALGMNAVG